MLSHLPFGVALVWRRGRRGSRLLGERGGPLCGAFQLVRLKGRRRAFFGACVSLDKEALRGRNHPCASVLELVPGANSSRAGEPAWPAQACVEGDGHDACERLWLHAVE